VGKLISDKWTNRPTYIAFLPQDMTCANCCNKVEFPSWHPCDHRAIAPTPVDAKGLPLTTRWFAFVHVDSMNRDNIPKRICCTKDEDGNFWFCYCRRCKRDQPRHILRGARIARSTDSARNIHLTDSDNDSPYEDDATETMFQERRRQQMVRRNYRPGVGIVYPLQDDRLAHHGDDKVPAQGVPQCEFLLYRLTRTPREYYDAILRAPAAAHIRNPLLAHGFEVVHPDTGTPMLIRHTFARHITTAMTENKDKFRPSHLICDADFSDDILELLSNIPSRCNVKIRSVISFKWESRCAKFVYN